MSRHKRNRGFDPFDFVMENTQITTGTLAGVGVVGKVADVLPSSSASSIISGMEPLTILPTMHAAGGVIRSMDLLKPRKRRR